MTGKKKCLIAGLLAGLMLAMTGCGNSEPVTEDMFAEVLDSHDFVVKNQSGLIKGDVNFDLVYLASPAEGKSEEGYQSQYQFEYYHFTDEDAAASTYEELDDELVMSYEKADGYVTTDAHTGKTDKRTVETDEEYYVVSRIQDTIVIAIAPTDEKDMAKEILDELGY